MTCSAHEILARLVNRVDKLLPEVEGDVGALVQQLSTEAEEYLSQYNQNMKNRGKASDWDIGKCYVDAFSKSKREHSPNCNDALHKDVARRVVYELGFEHGSSVSHRIEVRH